MEIVPPTPPPPLCVCVCVCVCVPVNDNFFFLLYFLFPAFIIGSFFFFFFTSVYVCWSGRLYPSQNIWIVPYCLLLPPSLPPSSSTPFSHPLGIFFLRLIDMCRLSVLIQITLRQQKRSFNTHTHKETKRINFIERERRHANLKRKINIFHSFIFFCVCVVRCI